MNKAKKIMLSAVLALSQVLMVPPSFAQVSDGLYKYYLSLFVSVDSLIEFFRAELKELPVNLENFLTMLNDFEAAPNKISSVDLKILELYKEVMIAKDPPQGRVKALRRIYGHDLSAFLSLFGASILALLSSSRAYSNSQELYRVLLNFADTPEEVLLKNPNFLNQIRKAAKQIQKTKYYKNLTSPAGINEFLSELISKKNFYEKNLGWYELSEEERY